MLTQANAQKTGVNLGHTTGNSLRAFRVGVCAAHPSKITKDGAPSVGMLHTEIYFKGGPPAHEQRVSLIPQGLLSWRRIHIIVAVRVYAGIRIRRYPLRACDQVTILIVELDRK